MLGYEKKESLYLAPENIRAIFNLAGIVMPSVMLNGRIVGKWKKKNRKLTLELFADIPQRDIAVIKGKAESIWPDLASIAFERN